MPRDAPVPIALVGLMLLVGSCAPSPSKPADVVDPPEAMSRPAAFNSVGRAPDFTCPIVEGSAAIASAPLPKPAYLADVIDPVYGHRIVRITGDPGTPIPNVEWRDRQGRPARWGKRERHHYSLDQAWNADMSLLVLDRDDAGHPDLYLDGTTYEVLFARNPRGGGELRWHPTDPRVRIFVRDNEIGYWNPTTDEQTVIVKLPGYRSFRFGPSKGNPSLDGTRIAVHAVDPQERCVTFAYDLKNRLKYPDIPLPDCESYVTISPSGNYVLIHLRDGSDSSLVHAVDGSRVGPVWSAYGEPSHFDLVLTPEGEEVAVGVNKNPASPTRRRQIARRLTDGRIVALTTGSRFSHTSTRNIRRPGWAYVSGYGSIAALKLDGSGTIERYGDPRSAPNGYWTEPHASPSPDGRRIVFASNWGDPDGPIGAYVLEICGG